MTLENDSCKFCKRTQRQLKKINSTLECLRGGGRRECASAKDRAYSRPILFTHFPLFRDSDQVCPAAVDSEIGHHHRFREKYDCLSKDSTDQVLKQMNPRLVFNGHTHFSCFNELHGVPEYTLASFSWRNIKTPSMLLVQVDGEEHFVDKCFLPSERNVFYIYGACLGFVIALGLYALARSLSPYLRLKPTAFKRNLE